MKLVLPVPRHRRWRATPSGAYVELASQVFLHLRELEPLPLDLVGWRDRLLAAGAVSGRFVVTHAATVTTTEGWPMELVHADIVDPASGQTRERRIHALYRVLEHGAAAVAYSPSPAQLDACAPTVLELFAAARLDWSSEEPVALADVWGLP